MVDFIIWHAWMWLLMFLLWSGRQRTTSLQLWCLRVFCVFLLHRTYIKTLICFLLYFSNRAIGNAQVPKRLVMSVKYSSRLCNLVWVIFFRYCKLVQETAPDLLCLFFLLCLLAWNKEIREEAGNERFLPFFLILGQDCQEGIVSCRCQLLLHWLQGVI